MVIFAPVVDHRSVLTFKGQIFAVVPSRPGFHQRRFTPVVQSSSAEYLPAPGIIRSIKRLSGVW